MKKTTGFFWGILGFGIMIGIFLTASTGLFQKGCAQENGKYNESAASLEEKTIFVSENIGKSVVAIKVEAEEKARRYFSARPFGRGFPPQSEEEDPFDGFFRDFFGQMPEQELRRVGMGSGVIIDKEGYILTNEHVVDGAKKIKVKLADGREFSAEIKGRDERSDLAVIKINARNLPVASFGDSSKLKIGQWVLAVGNPFGFAIGGAKPTVTVGVVSALHRSLPFLGSKDKNLSDLIQTDAAINPGNSGGPLVNLKGEIIGINVAILSTSGGYQGVGFAIPSSKAKKIVAKLVKGEDISYGWLGVSIQDLNDDLRKYFNIQEQQGVVIAKVFQDSPAAKAGLKEGDVILKASGNFISDKEDIVERIGELEEGKVVELLIVRDGSQRTVSVTIGKRPKNLEDLEAANSRSFRGLDVSDLTDPIVRRYNINQVSGVLIIRVEPGSPAEEAELEAGEIIEAINGVTIATRDDFEKAVRDIKGDVLIKTNRKFAVVKEQSKE